MRFAVLFTILTATIAGCAPTASTAIGDRSSAHPADPNAVGPVMSMSPDRTPATVSTAGGHDAHH